MEKRSVDDQARATAVADRDPPQNDETRGAQRPAWYELRLWQIQFIRDLTLVVLVIMLFRLAYILQAVTIPLLTALILADVLHPVVTAAEKRLRWPRLLTTMLCAGSVLATIMIGVISWAPEVTRGLTELITDFPKHAQTVLGWAGVPPEEVEEALKNGSLGTPQDAIDKGLSVLGIAASVLGNLLYWVVASAFMVALMCWLLVRYDHLPEIAPFLPLSRRERLAHVIKEFRRVFTGFVRGQVLVAIFTTAGFSIGFTLIGVPYAMVAALVGGLLSFIPNGQASGWLLAMLFSALGPAGSVETFAWTTIILKPTMVYAVTQSLETFVVTPIVQSNATRLHPLAIVGALIAGTAVGGLFGTLLAIPVAACLVITFREIVAPSLRNAAHHA